MKDEWKNTEGEWHKWLDPKHEKLYVVKETTCYKNIKYTSKRVKKKLSSSKARCARSCSHTSIVGRSVFHEPEVQREHMSQSFPNPGIQGDETKNPFTN